ncbi:Clavaminate synthase-like protein [Microthyrium microscopicum]|uniref:Clavaminate synthase-like protein n=1 Tax=Microthyrium microscopicum TaxID=703497 RepID=A0A6A6TYY1_9PEZI|nr:Clavaminate synthase-like protein [Microthyrium microscopicum]
MASQDIKHASPVTVSLKDLENDSIPFEALETAFGPQSLGILVVKDLPATFPNMRHNLLSYSSYLANLPQETLESLENPHAKWLVGWSCGKEKLKSGQYDTLKGSYYVNCNPSFAETLSQANLADRYPSFPEYTAANVWPPEDALPGFEQAFKALCSLIIDVAALVARACDRYASVNVPEYRAGSFEHVVRSSSASKARLLHYFPPPSKAFSKAPSDEDDWCATHVDHGCLTGLTSAAFIDEAENVPRLETAHFTPLAELDGPPDPRAGLYIHSRTGETVKVAIPRDCLAFQTGEALEVITKGRFRAVPHFVRGATMGLGGQIARNTLAVFTQPNLWEMVDEERDFAAFAREIVEKNH